MSDEIRSEEPQDRLTRICDAMGETFRAHPEYREGDKGVALLNDGARAGAGLFGYDSDTEAFADVLEHLRAIVRVHGGDLVVVKMTGTHDGGTPASPRDAPPSPN